MLWCIYIQKASYQNIDGFIKNIPKIIALGNWHLGGLLFSWKCPEVMKHICNVPFASWSHSK